MKCVKHFAYGVIKRENIFLYSLFGFQLYNFILILVSHHLQLYIDYEEDNQVNVLETEKVTLNDEIDKILNLIEVEA